MQITRIYQRCAIHATAIFACCGLFSVPATAQEHRAVYFYSDLNMQPSGVRWEHVTHLIWYDPANLSWDGRFIPPTDSQIAELRTLRDLAHQKGKKLLYGTSAWFEYDAGVADRVELMLTNATLRANFVRDLSTFVKSNDLDGADLDLEYPYSTIEQNGWATLVAEMRDALGKDRLLTACVSFWAVQVSVSAINSALDWVQIMSYHYRDLTASIADIQRYLDAGVYPSKILLGVAFTGASKSGGQEELYKTLVPYISPYDPAVDTVTYPANGYVYSLGGNRTTQKAKLWAAASMANGTMIWHLASDTTDPTTSLAVALTEARTNRVAVLDGYEQASDVDLGNRYTTSSCQLAPTRERACGDTALQATFSFNGTQWTGGHFVSKNFPTDFAFPSSGQLRLDFDILDAQPNVTLYLRLFDSAGLKADYYNTLICGTAGWKRLLLPRSNFTADAGFDYTNIRSYAVIAQFAKAGSPTTMRAIFDNFVMLDPTPSDRPIAVDATLLWNENYAANQWDTLSARWLADNRSLAYYEGGKVWFDDSASQHTVAIPANINPGSVDVSASANYVFTGAGAITGGASLRKQNSGTLTIQNGNSFSGTVTVSGGKLKLDGTTGGGLYRMADFFGIQNQTYLTVKNGATFSTWNWDYGSANALGYLRHNYGQIMVDGGIVEFDDTFSSRRAFSVGANGGTLSVTSGHTYTKAVGAAASDNLIRFTADSTLTLGGAGDGVIEDTLGAYGSTGFSIAKSGAGNWTLSGTGHTYTGATSVTAGTLILDDTARTGAQNPFTSATGSISVGASGALALRAGGSGVDGSSFVISRAITGSGTLRIDHAGSGSREVKLTGSAGSFAGTVDIGSSNGQRIRLTEFGTLAAGSTIHLGEHAQIWSGMLNGKSVAITVTQADAADTQDGLGSIRISAAADTLSGTIAIPGDQAKIDGAGLSGTINSQITGSGRLVIGGWSSASVFTLGGSNTFAGGLALGRGTTRMGSAAAIPSGTGKGNVTLDATGVLDLNGFSIGVNGLWASGAITNSGGSPATLTLGNNNQHGRCTGDVQDGAGRVALIKTGVGNFGLSGGKSFTGGVTLTQGILCIDSDAALGVNAGVYGDLTLNGGTLYNATLDDAGQFGAATNPTLHANRKVILGNSGGTVGVWPNSQMTIEGVISGNGALAKIYTGTLTLRGANTYAGGTTVSKGTLELANTSGSATGSGTVTVSSGAAMSGSGAMEGTLINGGTLSPAGTINVGGSLTLQSTSTLSVIISASGAGRLNAGQSATYGGQFSASLADGFTPAEGASYTIITASGTRSGSFSHIASGERLMMGDAGSFRVTYASSDLVLDDFRTDTDLDGMPDAYEVAQRFNRSSAADAAADSDGDGMSNVHEYLAGTDPLDILDVLKAMAPTEAAGGVTIRFPTVVGKTYVVEWILNLNDTSWQTLATVSGTGGELDVTDTGAQANQWRFYRIRLVP